jgi:alkylation response protein AidB-like acyl-CoA dehydrogenase
VELTAEQEEIRALARRFADEKIAPHAAEWDRAHAFPSELIGELADLGLMGVCIPEEQGGAGADFLSYVLVLEELSRGDAGVGVTVAVHTSACTLPLLDHGSPYVPALAAGEEVGAFALTEAGSGSDASAMTTRHRDGLITGAKQWITNGSFASTILVFARDEDGRIGAFVVREGFTVAREEEKLGLNSSSTADLVFEDTPAERLGEPGKGMAIALRTLDGGRIGIAAQAVGIAQAAFELATSYAKERHAFGGPIAQLGAIQQKLADMQTEIERRRSCSPRGSRGSGPARRSRSSEATATRRSSRPSATTATRRSPRSTRGRRRSSGW